MTDHSISQDNKHYDVLIVGAGLVGASLACALENSVRDHDLKVALVEPHDLDEPRKRPPSFDARASALSYGTRKIYEALGLWSAIDSEAESIKQVHVSDKGHFGVTRLNHEEEGVPALGYVVENFVLGEVLLNRLEEQNRKQYLSLYNPAEVTRLTPVPEGMSVCLDCAGEETLITASLVVLADGGRSGLMEQLCINKETRAYDQHALIANITLDRSHEGIAYERFAERGPMALLPLKGHRSALVWTVPNDEIDDIRQLDDSAFLERLQARFGYRAGHFLAVGKRDDYPLAMTLAKEQVRPGLVVLGNAAHAIHPVAGQGYNLAIRDTMALADNIAESLNQGESVGKLSRLLQYLEAREGDQHMTTVFCDGLVKLFTRMDTPSILARNLGLSGLDYMKPVKSHFARKAMGL